MYRKLPKLHRVMHSTTCCSADSCYDTGITPPAYIHCVASVSRRARLQLTTAADPPPIEELVERSLRCLTLSADQMDSFVAIAKAECGTRSTHDSHTREVDAGLGSPMGGSRRKGRRNCFAPFAGETS